MSDEKSSSSTAQRPLELAKPYQELDLAADAQFGHDGLDLCAHGANADATVRCHEFRRPAFRQLLSYFRFSRCERVGAL